MPVVAAVELSDTKYDAATATFHAQAKILPSTPGPHLQHYNKRHLAQQLPATFGQAALFIDTAPFGSTNFCEIQAYNDSSGNASLNATSDVIRWKCSSVSSPPSAYTDRRRAWIIGTTISSARNATDGRRSAIGRKSSDRLLAAGRPGPRVSATSPDTDRSRSHPVPSTGRSRR